MKKLLTIAMAVASVGAVAYGDSRPPAVIPIYNNNEPVKTVSQPTRNMNTYTEWQSLFRPIAQCVSNLQKEPTAVAPEDKTKYLARYGYGTGYFVLINTKRYTLDNICYLEYTMTKYGYKPMYIEPIDTLVGGIFRRKADAEALAKWLKKEQGIHANIEYIESDKPFVPLSNPNSQPPYKTSIRITNMPANLSSVYHFEKLQNKYDKSIYKRLLNDEKTTMKMQKTMQLLASNVQTLEQRIVQLEKQAQHKQMVYCTADQGLIFREKPSWNYKYQKFKFYGGEYLKVLATEGDFYKVKYNNKIGYVSRAYCRLHVSY